MSSFFDYFSRQLESMAWDKLSREDQLAQLSTLCDENFRSEYECVCDCIRDDAYNLAASVNAILEDKNKTLEEVEHDRAQLVEHLKELEVFHAEFLRRYFERKRPQGGTKNATV